MIGHPKYNYGDKVKFTLDNITYSGIIYIVDEFGTFEDNSDVSYDIMVKDWGPKHEECLFKHITEKLVSREITINDGRIREYDVNVKLEHKIYSQIYTILLDLKNNKKHLDIHLKNMDINKICDAFWYGKDKDIVD